MDLCDLTAVKSRLEIPIDVEKYDSPLSDLIRVASSEIESFLERNLTVGTYTEYFDVIDKRDIYLLKAYPVSSITSIKVSTTWEWDSTTAMASTGYKVKSSGELYVNPVYLLSGPSALQVVYVGGLATNMQTLVANHRSLSDACVRHVCFLYNTGGKNAGATNVTSHSGNVSYSQSAQFSGDVMAILNRYKRRRFI